MKLILSIALGCALLLLALLLSTTPTSITSLLLVVPFVLVFVIFYSVVFLVFRQRSAHRLQRIRLSAVFAGLPVALLVLQSIGQLTLRDSATIIALFLLSYFYFKRSSAVE